MSHRSFPTSYPASSSSSRRSSSTTSEFGSSDVNTKSKPIASFAVPIMPNPRTANPLSISIPQARNSQAKEASSVSSSMSSTDPSTQDFSFEDIFSFSESQNSADTSSLAVTRSNLGTQPEQRTRDWSKFSFSHYPVPNKQAVPTQQILSEQYKYHQQQKALQRGATHERQSRFQENFVAGRTGSGKYIYVQGVPRRVAR